MAVRRVAHVVSGADLACVAAQLGRTPQAMSRIVARCRWGYPAAVEDLPYSPRGAPFPTLFYATCPTFVAALSRLEADGGVKRFEDLARSDASLRESLRAAVVYDRRRRWALATRFARPQRDGGASLRRGVAGVADPRRLKCLHAHGAHALARPGYALGALALAEAGELWCADGRCAGCEGSATGALSPGRPLPAERPGAAT